VCTGRRASQGEGAPGGDPVVVFGSQPARSRVEPDSQRAQQAAAQPDLARRRRARRPKLGPDARQYSNA